MIVSKSVSTLLRRTALCTCWTLFAALLAGCQLLPGYSLRQTPPLLAPATAGFAVQANQVVILETANEQHRLLAVLSIDREKVELHGLSPMGQRLMRLHYDGTELEFSHSEEVELPISPEWLLAQLQLAYWPRGEIAGAYSHPWRLSHPEATRRVLWLGQKPAITVTYMASGGTGSGAGESVGLPSGTDGPILPAVQDQVRIEHHGAGLTVIINTLKVHLNEGQKP